MFKIANASGFTVLIDLAEQIGNGLGFVGRHGKVGFVCAVGEGCAVGFSKVESDGVGVAVAVEREHVIFAAASGCLGHVGTAHHAAFCSRSVFVALRELVGVGFRAVEHHARSRWNDIAFFVSLHGDEFAVFNLVGCRRDVWWNGQVLIAIVQGGIFQVADFRLDVVGNRVGSCLNCGITSVNG